MKYERRLARLENEGGGGARKIRFDLWIDAGDGILRNKNGDGGAMTREAFAAAFPDARKITLSIFEKDFFRSL